MTTATTYDPDAAASEYTMALDACRLAEDIGNVAAGLADTIYGNWTPATHMTCFEVDALALMLLAGGQRFAAERVIYTHSTRDFRMENDRHVCAEEEREDFSRLHCDTLIMRHAARVPVYVRPDGDAPSCDMPAWTVEISGEERHDGELGYLYALYAPDADTAAAYAMTYHLHGHERPDLDPGTLDHNGEPMHVVTDVTPGFKRGGYVNDLRAARFTAVSDRRTAVS